MGVGSIGDYGQAAGTAGLGEISGDLSTSKAQTPQHQLGVPPVDNSGAPAVDDNAPLTEPKGSYSSASLTSASGACASFFGSVLALIQEMSSDMIRDNRQIAYDSQMMAADSMEQQADKTRDKALAGLVAGVIQGTFQIAGGAMQMGMTIKGLSDVNKMTGAEGRNLFEKTQNALTGEKGQAAGAYLQNIGNLGTAFGQMTQGIGSIAGATGTYLSTMADAEIKEMEADQKRLEAFADQIKSINESFRQTVQSAIETSRTISQSMVETNKRILA